MKEVIEYYNNGQSEWEIIVINSSYDIMIKLKDDEKRYVVNIGFYEWLFNPIYKVFEVFNICECDMINLYDGLNTILLKNPDKILLYLKNQLESKQNE
jgi:hypothetical protein